jgi:hypothetical protein
MQVANNCTAIALLLLVDLQVVFYTATVAMGFIRGLFLPDQVQFKSC